MKCPICNNHNINLKSEVVEREFRKEKFKVFEQYYFCNKCKNDFTATQQDGLAISQVFNQYREKYNIPFPEEIKSIREIYGLSAKKMAEILGFGINQYRNYEAGEMPNKSNAKILKLISIPENFKSLIEQSKNNLDDKLYSKIIKRIEELNNKSNNDSFLKQIFCIDSSPNSFNGFKKPSFEKFVNMVLFFINNAPYKTRLNKLLFYADFSHFKEYGYSISGMKYAAIPNGPVPDQFAPIFGMIERAGFITTELNKVDNNEYDKFETKTEFNFEMFSENEMDTLNKVLQHFQFKKTTEIIKLSHNEKAWIENEKKSNKLISYLDYAFKLTTL